MLGIWSLEEGVCGLGAETLGSQGYSQKKKRSNPGPHGMPQCPEERGCTNSFPLTSKPLPPCQLQTSQDLSVGPGHASFSPVGSSSRCALTVVGPGTVQRAALSAPAPRGPFRSWPSSPSTLQGLPRLPPGPRDAALTAQQQEEAERCRSPGAGRWEPRAAGSALRPERGHRAANRRGGAAALSRARAGAAISPSQAAGSRAASSQGLGRLRPRGGRGRRPGPAGWRGSRCPTRPWRPPLPPPGRRWLTLSASSPCGAGQLPS